MEKQQKPKRQPPRSTTDAWSEWLRHTQAEERFVVGAVLLESEAILRVGTLLQPEHFYNDALATIYRAAWQLWREGKQVEMLKVTERLLRDMQLEKAGGAYALSQLPAKVASTVNLEEHALYVRQCYTQRQLLEAGGRIREMAGDLTQDIADQVQSSLQLVERIALDMDYANPQTDMKEAVDKALAQYEEKERLRALGTQYGILSGLATLDKYVCGFKPGDLVVVGARPGMGKTSLLLHFAKSMATAGKQVCIFSLEMGDVSLANRLILSYLPGMDTDAFRGGTLAEGQKRDVYEAAGQVRMLPITIDETPNISVAQLKVRCMNLRRKQGLDVVMIDYLQLMNMRNDNRQYNREQEIAQTTRLLKQLAKELQVPILLLSQLNRNVETKLKDGKKPTSLPQLSDLRESGAIEQDADVVLLIHRPEYYGDTDAVKGVGLILIAKQRDGRTGKVQFRYNEALTVISDAKESGDLPF